MDATAGSRARRSARRGPDPSWAGNPHADAGHDREPDPHDVARRIVLQRLTARPHSRAELADILDSRGCSPAVATAILDRMAEVGLVDDPSYARLVVDSRHGGKGWARAAVAKDLRRRGVADEVASVALAQVGEAAELARARELVDRRLPRLAGLPVEVQTRRLAGMLARRGYRAQVVYAVVREAVAADGTSGCPGDPTDPEPPG